MDRPPTVPYDPRPLDAEPPGQRVRTPGHLARVHPADYGTVCCQHGLELVSNVGKGQDCGQASESEGGGLSPWFLEMKREVIVPFAGFSPTLATVSLRTLTPKEYNA